jgi:hypothetical protein
VSAYWRQGHVRSFWRYKTLHHSACLVCQLHHRLWHHRVPGVASLASLIAVGFAVPVCGYVQTERAHHDNQQNGYDCI